MEEISDSKNGPVRLESFGFEDCELTLEGMGVLLSTLGTMDDLDIPREAFWAIGQSLEVFALQAHAAWSAERTANLQKIADLEKQVEQMRTSTRVKS